MNPQMRLLIMLAVLWAGGSLLFAAERTAPPAETAPAAARAQPANESAPAPQEPATPSAEEQPAEEQAAKEPAEDEPAAGSQDGGAEEGGAAQDAAAETAAAEDQDPAPPQNRRSGADRASPQRFEPSEQVRADFDVSFPIDI